MDLGYYSLCRWDGQNPCGFLCEEGAIRNNNNKPKKISEEGQANMDGTKVLHC